MDGPTYTVERQTKTYVTLGMSVCHFFGCLWTMPKVRIIGTTIGILIAVFGSIVIVICCVIGPMIMPPSAIGGKALVLPTTLTLLLQLLLLLQL